MLGLWPGEVNEKDRFVGWAATVIGTGTWLSAIEAGGSRGSREAPEEAFKKPARITIVFS